MRQVALLLSLCTLAFACAEQDTDAPPAPVVDPVTTPTAEPTQVITGSAEYGATVRISGGASEVQTQADPFTARFRAEVPLQPSTSNALAVTATDSDGNVSEPTLVTIDTLDAAISIQNLLRNGSPCVPSGTPEACVVSPDDFLEFTVVATDNRSLTELSYTAFFATAGASGTLRNRTVLVPVDATLPISQPFSFTVPNAAFLEDVALTALSIDGEGNRSTSRQILLRLTLQTFKGRAAALVLRDLQGGQVQRPEDVAVTSAGEVLVANTGAGNILALAPGAVFPSVRVSATAVGTAMGGGWQPGFLTLDSAGNLYATEAGNDRNVLRVAANGTVTEYLNYTAGNLRGLTLLAASTAKGVVNVLSVADGTVITLGAVEYEVDINNACGGSRICVPAGASTATLATALAACITSGSGCTVGAPAGAAGVAHPDLTATASSSPTEAVVLAARAPGAAANALPLASSACGSIDFNLAQCSDTLAYGAGETLVVGQEGNGEVTDTVFRFELGLSGLPRDQTAASAGYDLSTAGPVPHEQWGVALRSLTTATARARQDLVLYWPDETTGGTRLRAARVVDQANPAPIFNSAAVSGGRSGCGDCIRGTNDTSVPLATFGRLWDVELMADGCLLVSDSGRGNLYAVDTRDPAVADPVVSLVARGLPDPRGLARTPSGGLLVALRDADAIVVISPSDDPSDCF
ncbi:MAG: Ig-like domain-containing protein [Myxococcota bacterium]|nr:Ig-like domain-containing protein [Myxococcota bacterium]